MREEKYDISGMHCAACSASVERVTRKLPGVARSEVNLTTGIMTIAYDESQCTQEQIVAKVEKAGFGAALHLEHPAPATVQNAEDAETAALKRRKIELIAAAVFSAVLLYVSMGQMLPFGLPALPLPDLFSMHTHPMNFAVLQLILAVPVLYCGRNFFQGGFKSLFHGNPNMDSLVAIGSGCSFAYSLVMTFLISDDPSYVHNLYYESAAVVLTLVSLGKFLETRAKGKTGDPKALPAEAALMMATVCGARAQGRSAECGVIELGMDADLILLDFNQPHLIPCHNVLSHLVYAASGHDVALTMVRGKILYADGKYPTLDVAGALKELHDYAIPRVFSDEPEAQA